MAGSETVTREDVVGQSEVARSLVAQLGQVVLGQEETSSLPQAIFWLGVMVVAGLLAWFADRLEHRGRRSAMIAAGLFFVLGVFSNPVFAVVYLLTTLLSVAGFAGTSPSSGETSLEP